MALGAKILLFGLMKNLDYFLSGRPIGVLARSLYFQTHSLNSASPPLTSFAWPKLWNLQMPYKVKFFAWRACHDSLATYCNLNRRGIIVDTMCIACGSTPESALHLFKECRNRAALRSSCGLPSSVFSGSYPCIRSWLSAVVTTLSPSKLTNLFSLLHHIWLDRNGQVHGEAPMTSQEVLLASQRLSHDWQLVRNPHIQLPRRTTIVAKWQPPPPGKARGPTTIEGVVFLFGAQLSRDLGYNNIILEGDALEMVISIQKSHTSLQVYGHLLEEIHLIIDPISCVVTHTTRDGNRVADALAHLGRSSPSKCVLVHGLPPSTISLHTVDCNGLFA
ncbi:uncharacterized protein LOC120005500 [Tripterygium wilfordii]|uniref:uncharacterized protein LOC120005500 n=1 Tax=Tripterygium wilfordii TaxID=458696 RepID=UPI0018F83E1E|nr:uncharacterized protein LOC120005500 [Tripterygium wilfordii]